MNSATPSVPLVVTAGEPAGIGPDLCVQLASTLPEIPLVVIADRDLLLQRAAKLGIALRVLEYAVPPGNIRRPGTLEVIHMPLAAQCQPGMLDAANSEYVLATLRRAVQGCVTGEFSGMVTGPVHKGIINDASIAFTGHTEFLAEQTGTGQVVMMLVGSAMHRRHIAAATLADPSENEYVMRVALATTHLALKQVPAAITASLLENVLRIMQHDLQLRFGIAQPRILVAGLNPHAGEGGYLGREEIEVMIPVLDKLRAQGMNVSTPLPADTLFTPRKLEQCDCVLAMYHDQGLPVLKHASFGQGVNVTLGLPIIRTSVDHGTALDLAGSGRADAGSLLEAIRLAMQMSRHELAWSEQKCRA